MIRVFTLSQEDRDVKQSVVLQIILAYVRGAYEEELLFVSEQRRFELLVLLVERCVNRGNLEWIIYNNDSGTAEKLEKLFPTNDPNTIRHDKNTKPCQDH